MLYCIWHEHTHIQKVRGVILYMTWTHTHSKGKGVILYIHEHTHIQKVRGVILYMTWAHTHSKGKRCYIVYDMSTHTFKR